MPNRGPYANWSRCLRASLVLTFATCTFDRPADVPRQGEGDESEGCGNDAMDPGEACDDGNRVGGDGCSVDCSKIEVCGDGVMDDGEACDDGNEDSTDACVTCKNARCGDGVIHAGVEECDGAPYCSSDCHLLCGDGIKDSGEECDDGNTDAGDGCSPTCTWEPTCGDGVREHGEQCDDGNTDAGDGCSPACAFETCGNGIVDYGEQCDGNGAGMGGETATCNLDCTFVGAP